MRTAHRMAKGKSAVLEQFLYFILGTLPLLCLTLSFGAVIVYLTPFRWLGLLIVWILSLALLYFLLTFDVTLYLSGKGGDLPEPVPWILRFAFLWLSMVAVTFVPTRKWKQGHPTKPEETGS